MPSVLWGDHERVVVLLCSLWLPARHAVAPLVERSRQCLAVKLRPVLTPNTTALCLVWCLMCYHVAAVQVAAVCVLNAVLVRACA
jgi:O-antigen ligase